MSDPNPSSERYARQMLVPEIGNEGQARLAAARVLCIGAGGLGCATLPYLAGAGVGHLTIVDHDRVERSNLQRQVLFGESSLGRAKADAAAERLADLNPDITIEAMATRLDAGNIEALFCRHDLIIDGSDNYATKFLCGDGAVKFGRPLVYASATGMEAMIGVFDAARGPCLRCLFPEPPTGWVPNCAEAGVLGPLVGMAGCIQAAEAVKWLVGGTLEALVGRVWWIDARDMGSRQLEVRKRPDCAVCGIAPARITLHPAQAMVSEIDPAHARELEGAAFIDVREPDEFAQGHITGAVNVPLSKLNADPETELPPARCHVVYCRTGPRALSAVQALAQRYGEVRCLRGGILAWDRPLAAGPGADDGTGRPRPAASRDP